mmetsp:Transcript_582/g.1786  ORF Transcript_582/g.1786 Transcript_582/m.1786 type:complete len:173 (-) Transcript_582:61-579(-)
MAWLYSAMRWSGRTPEKLARAGSWRTADGYGFDRPLCALSGRAWCSHPGLVDPGRSRAELVEHILRNLAQRDTAWGLAEQLPASLLLILRQVGLRERAKVYCGSSAAAAAAAAGTRHKRYDGNISYHVSYGALQWLVARMQTYQEVFSRAAALFHTRAHAATMDVCGSGGLR